MSWETRSQRKTKNIGCLILSLCFFALGLHICFNGWEGFFFSVKKSILVGSLVSLCSLILAGKYLNNLTRDYRRRND